MGRTISNESLNNNLVELKINKIFGKITKNFTGVVLYCTDQNGVIHVINANDVSRDVRFGDTLKIFK